MALPLERRDQWGTALPLYEVEAEVAEHLVCEKCGTYWSPEIGDYAHLHDDEYITCSCGHHICQKKDLY